MPVCENCKTPFDEWQHFCLECGNYLRADSPPEFRCPQCGVQVALEQKFCHECAAPLKESATQPAGQPARNIWQRKNLILGGLGIVGCIVLYLAFHSLTVPTATQGAKEPLELTSNEAISIKGDARGPKTVNFQEDLAGVFIKIKEANLNKDILLYMDTLSAMYPHLDKKRQEIFRTWKKFDFKSMDFMVNKIEEVDAGQAIVDVNWQTSTQNLVSKEMRTDDFQYRVWLIKELGQWKIKKIDKL